MGFGRAKVLAVLGQSLEVSIPVHLENGENVTADCVSAEVFYGETKQAANSVRARWEPGNANDHLVRVFSSNPVDEPVVSVYATVGCNTRLTRKWVAFADPPANVVAESIVPAEAPPATSSPAPAPRAAAAEAAPRPRRAAPVGDAASQAPRRVAQAPVMRRAAPVAAAPRTKPQPKVAQEDSVIRKPKGADLRSPPVELTPRLRLDLIEAEALVAPNLKLAGDLPTPAPEDGGERRTAAAALWKALNASPEDLARDRDRVAQLETTLTRARDDMTATRNSLTTLQTRLEASEASRYTNPVTLSLAALAALLAAAVAWLWLQRKRDREAQAWWGAAGAAPEPVAANAGPAVAEAAAPVLPPVPTFDDDDDEADRRAGMSPPTLPLETAATRRAAAPLASQAAGPDVAMVDEVGGTPRHMSVEELIDLEQQADFFQVLGQDEAAIDLLVGHVRHPGGTSPLPYLKLMEIYQRRGDRKEYDEVRERFNGQFNAYAPGWEEELNQGRSLEDYPSVIGRLQTLWAMPARALEVLQASLLRHDANAATFDLPAYRELLFLYSLARDLAEVEEREGAVDLLLPVGDDEGGAGFTASSLGPLVPGADAKPGRTTQVVDVTDAVEFNLDAPQSESGSIDFDLGDVDATIVKGGRKPVQK